VTFTFAFTFTFTFMRKNIIISD
jgi:hypothetical protein